MAILHSKKSGTSARGDRVPKSVAGKYAGSKPSKNAPNSKGKEQQGGVWGDKHNKKAERKTNEARTDRKKKKATLRKALEEYLTGRQNKGAGCLVIDDQGRMLLGRRTDNGLWSTPGGTVEPGETFQETALRELKEESGITGSSPVEICHLQ